MFICLFFTGRKGCTNYVMIGATHLLAKSEDNKNAESTIDLTNPRRLVVEDHHHYESTQTGPEDRSRPLRQRQRPGRPCNSSSRRTIQVLASFTTILAAFAIPNIIPTVEAGGYIGKYPSTSPLMKRPQIRDTVTASFKSSLGRVLRRS